MQDDFLHPPLPRQTAFDEPPHEIPWTPEQFERRLRAFAPRYHINHPYQVRMNRGELDRPAIQGWVLNRFYYQVSIPQKDAAVLAGCSDREARRLWLQRIIDHDGRGEGEGGIERWLRLGEAVGLQRETMLALEGVLPGVRFAVDAYRNFVRDASWPEAACSSLTELFAPTIHQQRISTWPDHYPWIDQDGLAYFRNRLGEANRDVEHGLAVVIRHFDTPVLQRRALDILQFKLDILWAMLDAMQMAYVHDMPPYFCVDGLLDPDSEEAAPRRAVAHG